VKLGPPITSDAEHSFAGLPFVGHEYQHTAIKRSQGNYNVNGQTTAHIEGFRVLLKHGINDM